MAMVEFDDGAVRKAKLKLARTVTSNSIKSLTSRGLKSSTNYFIDN